MLCPHCGQTTPDTAKRCSSCNGLLPAGRHPQVAAGVLTPVIPSVVTSPDGKTEPSAGDPPDQSDAPPDEQSGATQPTELSSTADGAFAETILPSELHGRSSPSRAPQLSSSVRQAGLSGTSGLFAPGYTFGGRYHVIRLLGAGGMGAVYQAWDEELGVAVAIKVIRPEVLADSRTSADLERRFKRELLLARQVTHKNVVRIHDLGEVGGHQVHHDAVHPGLRPGDDPQEQREAPGFRGTATGQAVVAGLQAAHEAGVVHRDLKPANIMIEDGRALIMDFGIARSTSERGGTVAGAVVGTLAVHGARTGHGSARRSPRRHLRVRLDSP